MIIIIWIYFQGVKKLLDNENKSHYDSKMIMEKCHCARVPFDKIVSLALNFKKNYECVAKELNAGETCTACREDMKAYCESACANSQLQSQVAL